jgi:hypothetical protein
MSTQAEKPRWIRDLLRFLPLKSQFVLSGNVRDQFPLALAPGAVQMLPLIPYVCAELRPAGIQHFLAYDSAQGFSVPVVLGLDPAREREFFQRFGLIWAPTGRAAATPERLFEVLEQIVRSTDEPIALFLDFASRLLLRPDLPTECEQRCFTRALVLAHTVQPRPVGAEGRPFFNPIFWITEKEGDLPDWFVVGNPRLRHIPVPQPDHVVRRAVAATLGRSLPDAGTLDDANFQQHTRAFVESTEGLLISDLSAIVQLSRSEGLGFVDIEESVRRFKLGVTEDPWRKVDREKLRDATAFIRRRVKGQGHAVTQMLDIIKRAVGGLSERRPGGGRPRGVAFLAGPTGVGKTELAKTITQLLFGDESAYTRFDMSEFSAEHSDQRLIGAPPGYVGYDTGGELTNAVRQKPFGVVLFDEIEKAHPRILDKFLQILDDGVLTSGRGERVYFSETFIIFTSNLGIYRLTPDGERVPNVSPDDPFETVRARVRTEVDRHFKLELGRPEILNRIGENIIIFDFIRADVARDILDAMLAGIVARAGAAQQVEIALTPAALEALSALCLQDLSNGGRGIRNQLETHFVNPLARLLFDAALPAASRVEITGLSKGAVTSLEWKR